MKVVGSHGIGWLSFSSRQPPRLGPLTVVKDRGSSRGAGSVEEGSASLMVTEREGMAGVVWKFDLANQTVGSTNWATGNKTLTWWFKVTFLGWFSDPFKGLSDLQLGDEKVTLNHLVQVLPQPVIDIPLKSWLVHDMILKLAYQNPIWLGGRIQTLGFQAPWKTMV